MKGNKQATLFQSWGNQKKELVQLSSITERPEAASSSRDDGVIDLCESFDDDDDGLLCQAEETVNLELNNQDIRDNGEETNDWATEENDHEEEKECNISIGAENFTLTQKQTQCKNLPGFDMCAGKLWIYPTNYPVRDYQFNIVQQALFKNTMVTLPTGLGKTFIAAVVMYNFYRWYPQGKVVFMAPTKPLVAQQIEACYNIMGIPQDHTAEMTGSMGPPKREKAWQEKRVFFLTPQVLTNDLSRGSCPAEDVKCLVIDEAHKALGNHAYCQVVRELVKYTENFRVLALSATPGSDIKAVQQVLTNLLISHIEIRTEESIDIKQYSHERKVEKVVVPLGDELTKVKEKYVHIMDVVVSRLKKQGVIYNRDTTSLSKFLILKSREAFRQNPPERLPRSQYGVVEGDFALAMSLYHGYELLQLHGSRSLYNFLEGVLTGDKGYGRTRAELTKNADFNQLMDLLTTKYTVQPREADSGTGTIKPFVIGHPKMEKLQDIVLNHFNNFAQQGASATRVMIFSQYRDSVKEITDMLHVHQPLVKVMSFIGQSSAGKSTKGFTQKEQLKVMKQFREGGYNTLVSTCVGEEGLDIGDVDLIICFDAHKSPIRLVQRMGRTGRKREGRIVMLVTQGKEEQIYNQSQYSKKSIHKAILNGARSLHFYQHSPRMVPEQLSPKSHKMHITVKEAFKPTKRISTESKMDQSKITSLFNNGKKDEEEELITLDQYQELQLWQVDMHTVPQLPAPDMICLNKRGIGQVSSESSGVQLSLSEWSPWQNTLQQYNKVGHSLPSKHLVQLMEFTQLQQSLGPGDDPYGLVMAAYLNEDDVLKPGESETAPESILRYCVSNKPLVNGNSKEKDKKKLLRRSDTLPNFEDDNKDAQTSDEDLPSFALSPELIHQCNNEDKQMKNYPSEITRNNNQNNQSDVENLEGVKVETSHKKYETNCCNDLMSKKSTVGSRAKLLDRKMSESVLRKSKKRKRSKCKSANRTVVELIADYDSSDFDGVDSNIPNEAKNIACGMSANGRSDEQNGGKEQNYQCNNSLVSVVCDVESSFTTCFKIGSPPPIDEVVALCEDLVSNYDEKIDLIQLVDGWEKENGLRKYFVKPDNRTCFVGNPDDIQSLDLNRPNQEQTHSEPNQSSPISNIFDMKMDSVAKTEVLYEDCNKISSSEFSEKISKRKDASLKVEQKQRLTEKENLNCILINDRSDYSHDMSYAEVSYDKNIVPETHGINTPKSLAKTPLTNNDDEASLVLARPDFTSTVDSEREHHTDQNKTDSWLADSVGAVLPNVLKTQAALVKQVGELESATQVTFTQALASVHSSIDSESDIADKLQHNQMITNTQDLKPKINAENFEICGSFMKFKDNKKESVADGSAIELPVKSYGNHSSITAGLLADMPYPKDVTKQDKTQNIANIICSLNSDIKADLTCEKKMISFDHSISDSETDFPQFDLGYDIDEDIIPPSPNALQLSQKSVSECISQTFSSRMSQSRLSIAFSKKQGIESNIDSELQVADTLEQQSLSCHTNKRVNSHVEKITSLPKNMLMKPEQSVNLDIIPIDRVTDDDGSALEMKTRKASSPQLNLKIDKSCSRRDSEPMHKIVLTQADLQLSLSPVDEPSFYLMDEDDLEDLYEAESTLIDNKHAETDNTTQLGSVDSNRRPLESLVTKIIQDPVCCETANDQNVHKASGTELLLQSKAARAVKANYIDCSDEGSDDVLHRAEIKTPISKFRNRKSVFTQEDFSPDPFCDSFEFNIEQCSKTDNPMTALKSKSKIISVASSTPKQLHCGKDSIKLTTKSNSSPGKLQCKLENELKMNLHSESDSDDSFIVRRKKKPCIIESPCNMTQEDKENELYGRLKVFRTPVKDRSEVKKKMCDLKKKSDESDNLQEKNKRLPVSFLSNDDDSDFEDAFITKQHYVLPKTTSAVHNCGSDDDFDEPFPGKKKLNTRKEITDHSKDSSQPPVKLRKIRGSNPFIDEEAELSDDENLASSDESEHGLDHYEASFIHDTQQCSQLQAIDQADMQAVYMKSIRSPAGPGKFKLQYNYKNENVFSQIPEEESQYMEDSFCVAEEEDEWLGNAAIEPEEVTLMNSDVTILKSGRKRRQKGITKVFQTGREKALHQGRMNALNKIKSKIAKKNQNVTKNKVGTDEIEKKSKRHRICVLDDTITVNDINISKDQLPDSGSPRVKPLTRRIKNRIFSSSDEEEDNKIVNKIKTSVIVDSTAGETLTKLKSRPDSLRQTPSCESDSDLLLTDGKHTKNNIKAVILVDSKEISGSQDIISDLRFKHNIHVSAAQLSGCDYIISNRMAVERKLWSEFSNGANRAKLTERIQALIDIYDRPILIVEKDKVKAGEEKYARPLHWTKYVDKTVALFLRSYVRVLYTDSQLETASLLASLCELEKRKGMGIAAQVELTPDQQNKVKFFTTLPKLSYIHALNLCQGFRSISEFMRSSIQMIQTKGQMSENRAIDVYKFLRRQFDANLSS